MPRLVAKNPAYRKHRASGQTLVMIAGLALGICRSGQMFRYGMPDFRDLRRIGNFDGILPAVTYDAPGNATTKCDICVQARDNHLTIIMNGEKSFDRAMTGWSLGHTSTWFAGPYWYGLGVVDWYGQTTISRAEVTEISGLGEVMDETGST